MKTWCSSVKHVLYNIGCANIWENHLEMSKNDINHFLGKLKYIMQSQYRSFWYAAINDSNKHPILRTYSLFKSKLNLEKYISYKIPTKYKRLIAQLRVSSHRLRIETGRHDRPITPAEERFCKFCDKGAREGVIDDEKHFLLTCEFHDTERNILFTAIKERDQFLSRASNNKDVLFKYILCNEDRNIIEALGKYIEIGNKNRSKSFPVPVS